MSCLQSVVEHHSILFGNRSSRFFGATIPRSAWGSKHAIILPLANPRAMGFCSALPTALIDINKLSWITALEFGLAIVLIRGCVLIGYTALADHGRKSFFGSYLRSWINRGSAGALIGVTGTIALQDRTI